MKIVGITGTIGAGKGTVVDYLKSHYNFTHFSARAYIAEEITRRGLPVNRDTLTEVSNDIRTLHHPGYILEELCKRAMQTGTDVVLESIRTLGEIESLRKVSPDFLLLAITADQKKRYERILVRGSSTDHITFEKFVSDEDREMTNTDPNKQNIAGCIAVAEYVIENDGSLEELHTKIDEIMGKM